MSNIRLPFLAVLGCLIGSVTLLAVPTDEEKKAEKCIKDLKTSKDAKEKIAALKELGRLGGINGSLVKDAIPEIVKCLDDKDGKVRGEAAHSVGLVVSGEKKKDLVDKLTKMLKDEKDDAVRMNIAMGLGAMGGDAKDAVPALRDVMAKADKKEAKQYKMVIDGITGKGKN